MLVDLVDDEWVGTTNVLVLEHPQAIAYSLAGMHSRVVVSSGAIEALSDDEILAGSPTSARTCTHATISASAVPIALLGVARLRGPRRG